MNQFVARLFVFTILFALWGDLWAQHWPRFRGNNANGFVATDKIPFQWTEADYRWTADLKGIGNSSPIIWGNQVFVTAADEDSLRRWLICLDATNGREQWRQENDFKTYKKHKNNSFASSTPAADSEHVYQLWHSRDESLLIAYSHAGEEIWRSDLGPYLHGQGGAASPIVHGNSVYVAHDHKQDSFLVSLDRKNGEINWKVAREGKRACYATPCIRRLQGGRYEVVFTHCYEGIVGLDSETGQRNWHLDPFGRESQRALLSPFVSGNLVFAGSGAVGGERQVVAINVKDSAPPMASEQYRLTRQAPHVPTPLVVGGKLFLWADTGIATCCELDTGDVVWQKRIGGNYFASPIAVGDRIYNIDTLGEVVVISASDDFKVLARNKMGEGSRATMAATQDTLFVRTDSMLFAIGPAK